MEESIKRSPVGRQSKMANLIRSLAGLYLSVANGPGIRQGFEKGSWTLLWSKKPAEKESTNRAAGKAQQIHGVLLWKVRRGETAGLNLLIPLTFLPCS